MSILSDRRRWERKVRQANMGVIRLQISKFLRANVATDWTCDLLQWIAAFVVCLMCNVPFSSS